MSKVPEGKIPWRLLEPLLAYKGFPHNKGIIQNASPGIDIAALKSPEIYETAQKYYNSSSVPFLIYKSDPITFPTPDPAKYLITVNMNDLATCGAIPYGIMVTLLYPPKTTADEIIEFQKNLSEECIKHKISILGGHSEVTSSVNSPVYTLNMIGFVPPEFYIPRKPQPGDRIICSGWVGAEGTGILLSSGKDYLSNHLTSDEIEVGKEISNNLAISERICSLNKKYHQSVHLVHDATEGGIYGALYECLEPLGLGCSIDVSSMPLNRVTRKLSNILQFDPFKLISSGAVLIICDEKNTENILQELSTDPSTPASVIGFITDKGDSLLVDDTILTPPDSDHIIIALKNLESETGNI